MNCRSLFVRCGLISSLAALLSAPALVAQSSSSSDYASQAQSRAQSGSQYPNSGGGYGNGGYKQYPTYGNTDWHRLAIVAGGGFTAPAGSTSNELTYGWNVTAGAGYNFSKNFGTMLEYHFDRQGIQNSVLAAVGEPGGNAHIWSFTLDPIYRYKTEGKIGGYVTGGGGFYRRLTSFTEPVIATGEYCDFFYCYPYQYQANQVVSHYSSNQGGVNVGTGITFRPSTYSSGRLFAEARYEWINTPGRSTQLIPVTFGYRW